jgi:hypothetical protein
MSTTFSFHKAPAQPGEKPDLIDRDAQYSKCGRMSAWTTAIIITVLVGFAVVHVVGFMFMASEQPMVWPGYVYPTD